MAGKGENEEEFYDAVNTTPSLSTNDCGDDSDDAGISKKLYKTHIRGESESEEKVKKVEESLPDGELSEEELQAQQAKLSTDELEQAKETAAKLKDEGNACFKNDDFLGAISLYTEALNICPLGNTKDRAILYGNRAAAKMSLNQPKGAISDCDKAIQLWPDYMRVLIRRAKLNEQEDNLDAAFEDYKCINKLDPTQAEALQALIRLPPKIHERNEKLKAEMMSSLKDIGNMFLKPFGLSTNNFKMQQDPNTGSYSVNFQQ